MRPLPPSQPLIDISDDPDPAAESAQRVAAAAQAAQSALSTWAIYGQRAGRRGLAQDGQDRGEDRGDLHNRADQRGGQAQARDAERDEDLWRMASEPALTRPLVLEDAGLDAIGPGSALTAEQQLEVLHRYKLIPAVDPDVIDQRVAQVLGKPSTTSGVGDPQDAGREAAAAAVATGEAAKDEATEAGAMWAGNDDNLATVSYIGGTNRGASRSPLVRDAMGDATEQVAEEALRRQGDPLRGDPVAGDPVSGDPVTGDPLDLAAWDDPAQDGPRTDGPDPARGR